MDKLTEQLIEIASNEVLEANWAITQQFLDVHKIAMNDGQPVVNRVDLESEELGAIVYFNVEGEQFYFVVYLDIEPEVQLRWMGTEGHFAVYLSAGSKTMHANEIIAMTKLKPTRFWSVGDKRNNGVWTFTKVMFEPCPEADEFEDKLVKVLDYLEQDKDGVRKIVVEANGAIQVAAMFHNGNSMLGGVHLEVSVMQRLAALGLEIDFDLYAEGNLFLEDDDD